jgi:hypothetical protein
MRNILDRVAQPRAGSFRPKTVSEFFALQLARKLEDIERLQIYLILVEQHSEDTLLQAFRRTVNHANGKLKLAERFHAEIER